MIVTTTIALLVTGFLAGWLAHLTRTGLRNYRAEQVAYDRDDAWCRICHCAVPLTQTPPHQHTFPLHTGQVDALFARANPARTRPPVN